MDSIVYMEKTTEKAQAAFWAVVAAAYPAAKTGDLSPGMSHEFDETAAKAIREWVDNNVPDTDNSTAVENNHNVPDEALHVATLPTEKRYSAESLLARVVGAQTAYWDRLRELEQLLGFEIDSTQDLTETDLDTILANPGAPV